MPVPNSRRAVVWLLILSSALPAGCGAMKTRSQQMKVENALKALSIELRDFQTANDGRPPASADELLGFIRGKGSEASLRPGELETLTVQWGARLEPKSAEGGNRVLATGKKVGNEIGVMMQNGNVRWMTEDALTSAPKAEPAKRP